MIVSSGAALGPELNALEAEVRLERSPSPTTVIAADSDSISHTYSESIELLKHHALVLGPCNSESIRGKEPRDSVLELLKWWQSVYRPAHRRQCAGNTRTQHSERHDALVVL